MKTFYAALANSLGAFLANTFVWFAVTFWVYLETRSVIATAVMAGVYTGTVAVTGFFLGSLVDRYPKRAVMLLSSSASLILFALAGGLYALAPASAFTDVSSPLLWGFIVLALLGALVGNLRAIALSTLVTVLVPAGERGRANGLVGTANGVGFLAASVFSGLAVGLLGMGWVLGLAVAVTLLVIGHLWSLPIPPGAVPAAGEQGDMIDLPGTLAAIRLVPGLLGLILFHTFNNFLGGIYMALMDAYGLLLVSAGWW